MGILNETGVPEQPLILGITLMVVVISALVLLIVTNGGIRL